MTIPHSIREQVFKPSTDDGVIALIEINRDGWATPLYFTSHGDTNAGGRILSYDPLTTGVRHNGQDYVYAVVSSPRRPDDVLGEGATMPLLLENVVQDISHLVAQSPNDLVVYVTHVDMIDPEIVMEEFPPFSVMEVTADSDNGVVSMTLAMDPAEDEPETIVVFGPDQFPALYP